MINNSVKLTLIINTYMSKDIPSERVHETLISGNQKITESKISSNIKKEALILGTLLLNGFLLPSYLSLTYMSASMALMIMFQRPVAGALQAKVKKLVSLIMLFFSFITLAVDIYYILGLPIDLKDKLSEDQIRYYMKVGISFTSDKGDVDTFLTFLPKVISIVLATLLINVYTENQKNPEASKCHITTKNKSTLLNWALIMICAASCVVQSVVQLCLFIACSFWMVLSSRGDAFQKKVQTFLTHFCQVFFILSLPTVLYLELQNRLAPDHKPTFVSAIIFPPNVTVGAYSVYVCFTVVAFVLLSIVEKSKRLNKDTALVDSDRKEAGEGPLAALLDLEDFDSEAEEEIQVNTELPTYQPLVFRILLILDVMLCAFYINTLLSFVLLSLTFVLMFFPIGPNFLSYTKFVLLPASLLYFLYFYVINLNGLYPSQWETSAPWLLYKFKDPTFEIFLMFSVFGLTCKLNSFGQNFSLENYQNWQSTRRMQYTNPKSGTCKIMEFFLLKIFGQFVMIAILVAACLDVTLYFVILLYLSLFYMSLRKESELLYCIMLFWATFFVCAEYLTSQFNLADHAEMKDMVIWLDLSKTDNFSLRNLQHFAYEKVLILLVLWARLQLFRYLKYVSESEIDDAAYLLQKKSRVLNWLIKSSLVFERIIFVLTLVGMIFVLMFQAVSIVNWIFLILLYIFLVVNFAIKIGEKSEGKQKALNIIALVIIIYTALMIVIQTVFQFVFKTNQDTDFDMIKWYQEELPTLHKYSEFFGIELAADEKLIFLKFLTLSFYFLGSLILRRALIDIQYDEESNKSVEVEKDETLKTRGMNKQSTMSLMHKHSVVQREEEEEEEETVGEYLFLEFAERFYFLWAFGIIALALHWKISLVMLICLGAVLCLLFKPAFFPYPKSFSLDDEKASKESKKEDESLGFEKAYIIQQVRDAENELNMVMIRQKVTLVIFAVVGISIILMYPSELLFRFIDLFPSKEGIYKTIFYMNWVGIYHSQTKADTIYSKLYDNWGYLVIMLVMFMERYLQTQLYVNRTEDVQKLLAQARGEEPIKNISKKHESLREKLLRYVEAKYQALIFQTCRQGFECLAIFVCLVSVGYMSNTLGLIYLFFALLTLFCYDVEVITVAAALIIIVQYLFCLLNLTDSSSPQGFPQEINENIVKGQVAFPIADLANNPNFAYDSWFFAMDDAQKNGIWIDFILLLALSYYMRIYKLPFNVLIIPKLSTYCKQAIKDDRVEQIDAKVNQARKDDKTEEQIETIRKNTFDIVNSVDPQVEYEEIKKASSTSRWTLRLNFGRILSQHIIVNTLICFLVVLNTSLVSIITLPIFLYMFSKANNRQFVKFELPAIVSICLKILVADLLIQIMMQTPFYNFIFDMNVDETTEDGNAYDRLMEWFQLIGWRIIWNRNTSPASTLNVQAFADFVCKVGATCILLLQYYGNGEKDVSWENWEDDVDRLFDLSETKQICMTYKFNNKKVQKIILSQREKQHRAVLIREIEGAVSNFSEKQGQMKAPLLTVDEPIPQENPLEGEKGLGSAFVNLVNKVQLEKIKEIQTDIALRDEFVATHTKRLVEELGWFASTTQNLRNKKSEQILFIYENQDLEKYRKKATRGMIKVGTELEESLRLDILEWLLRKQKEEKNTGISLGKFAVIQTEKAQVNDAELEEEERLKKEEEVKQNIPQLSDMKRTNSYSKTRVGFSELMSAVLEVVVANSATVACLLMIFCHLINGALLTAFYPLAVFAYALLEESKPQKWFWSIVIYYSIGFVFLRFASQFNFGFEEYLFWTQKYYIGLEPIKEGYQMISYILCEILIISVANLAKLNLDILGIDKQDELETEKVGDAMKRFIENSTIQARVKKAIKQGNDIDEDDAKHIFKEMDEDAPLIKNMSALAHLQREVKKETEEHQARISEVSNFKNISSKVKAHLYSLNAEQEHDEEFLKQEDDKEDQIEKVAFLKRNYFERLFPSILEQKPGKDYYPGIFALQIFVLIYTLLLWELMNGKAVSVSDALNSDSLSSEMVTFFMIQLFFMCVDRYLSNAKMTTLKETEFIKSKEEINGKELLKNFDITYKPDGDSLMQNEDIVKIAEEKQEQMRKAAKLRRSQALDEEEKAGESDDDIQEGTFQINRVKLQTTMATKYYFHMAQLTFVHLLVFFYLPFKGNYNLHTEIYCDPRDDPNVPGVKLYECNTFNSNTSLIVFYLLYCWQFYLAALQIRHGYPEVRKSNFLMSGSYEGIIKGGDLLFMYTMLPFVMEIKVLLDWTFSRTALDIYQWFKLTNIHYEIYIFRCGNYEYTKRKTGEAIDVIDKALCGGFFLALVFVLLISPLYLFSDLSMALNPVVNSNLHFKMMIQNDMGLNSELSLFDTTLVEQITTYSEQTLVDQNLEMFFTDDNTKDYFPQQIQEIKMSQYSQELWGATPPLKQKFVKALSEDDTEVSLQFNVNFKRSVICFQFKGACKRFDSFPDQERQGLTRKEARTL